MIVMAGAGALGSLITINIASPDLSFLIVDDDMVEEHNIGTSAYMRHHVGAFKAIVLAEMLYRKCGARARVVTRTIDRPLDSSGLWSESISLVVDTFDNVEARSYTCGLEHQFNQVPTIHIGVSEQRTGEVMWDEDYILPESEHERGTNPICTHHLGRRILRFTAAVAAGAIEDFIATGRKRNFVTTESMNVISV